MRKKVMKLQFTLLEKLYSVYRFNKEELIPAENFKEEFFSITRTLDELSIVCREGLIDDDVLCENGWEILKVEGPLDFSLIGILSHISQLMSNNSISIYALSTYDTDYILIKKELMKKAIMILEDNGHIVK